MPKKALSKLTASTEKPGNAEACSLHTSSCCFNSSRSRAIHTPQTSQGCRTLMFVMLEAPMLQVGPGGSCTSDWCRSSMSSCILLPWHTNSGHEPDWEIKVGPNHNLTELMPQRYQGFMGSKHMWCFVYKESGPIKTCCASPGSSSPAQARPTAHDFNHTCGPNLPPSDAHRPFSCPKLQIT